MRAGSAFGGAHDFPCATVTVSPWMQKARTGNATPKATPRPARIVTIKSKIPNQR